MKHSALPYQITEPPARLKKARLDNVTLVPASLLPLKGTYQPLANRLPKGSVLCVPGTPRQQKLIAKITQFFRGHGRQVITVPIEKITRKITKPRRPGAENLRLACHNLIVYRLITALPISPSRHEKTLELVQLLGPIYSYPHSAERLTEKRISSKVRKNVAGRKVSQEMEYPKEASMDDPERDHLWHDNRRLNEFGHREDRATAEVVQIATTLENGALISCTTWLWPNMRLSMRFLTAKSRSTDSSLHYQSRFILPTVSADTPQSVAGPKFVLE